MEEKKKKSKIIWWVMGIVLTLALVALALVFFFLSGVRATNSLSEPTLILVKNEDGINGISDKLISKNVIASKKLFYYYAKFNLVTIKAGYYEFPSGASIVSVVNQLRDGKTKIVKLTFPEGFRAEQMAIRLADSKVVSYADFLIAARKYEGKLFPDTYFFNPIMTGEEVVKMMLDDYSDRTKDLVVTNHNLIVASIVEKESSNDADRPLIAGIYLNRVKAGMKLQSDPTVAYGRDTNALAKLSESAQKEYTFWKAAKTVEFTSVISPYNTYLNSLPIGPICNPGIKSIEATLNPQTSNYYYFLYGRDGKIYPAKTQAEHEANVAKYM
ncbi:MAG: endolytic transglycosylase MltG [Patescibacteria group bacterium]|jgi:UPF0755 protein